MKKILCLTSHDSNAADYGSVLRVRHIVQMLANFGEISIALGSRYEDVLRNAKPLQGGFKLVDKFHFRPVRYSLADHFSRKFNLRLLDIEGYKVSDLDREKLQNLMAGYDLIWVHSLEFANSFGIWQWPKTILDVDDLPSSVYRQRYIQATSLSFKYWYYRQMLLWRRNEKRLEERFEGLFVCSKSDQAVLGGGKKIVVLPNCFDAPKKMPARKPATPPLIGFVGTFIYEPNREGIRWFLKNVWPLILEKFPEARLRIAGEGGHGNFDGRNVETLGWVTDMENEMATWSIAIVPLFVGGGTRIKILEAFSRKCPVVSTTLGAYGLNVNGGCELLIADSAEDFAKSCIRILSNPSDGERLAEKAWNKFLQNWTWDSQAGHIKEIVSKVLASPDHAALNTDNHTDITPKATAGIDTKSATDYMETSTDRISVIIPAFNRAYCIARAVESVFAQTFKNLEIIAVDDGSTDGTADVLKKFGNKITLIRQQNRGVSAARNAGIRAARGNWIAFLDSDDCWHPEKLEKQLDAITKYSAKICFTRSINAQNELFRDIEFVSSRLQEPGVFYVQNAVDAVSISPRHPMIQTMVAEKKLLEEVGLFDESFPAAEDAELIFRLSFFSGFLYIDQPLTTVFENSINSLTYSEKLGPITRRNQSYLRLLAQMYWRLAEISPEKISVLRERLGYFMSRRAEIACASGQLPVARRLAWDGILFAGNFRDFARCAGILLLPNLVRFRAQKKWPA